MSKKQHHYYVYIIASRAHVLYCGMTNDLERRVAQHKAGVLPGFTQNYNRNRLVWFERYRYVRGAIAREKQIKAWTRERKLSLINEMNPSWADLSEEWGKQTADPTAPLRSGSRSQKGDGRVVRKDCYLTDRPVKNRLTSPP